MTFEVMGFVRDNCLMADFLDDICNVIPLECNLIDSPVSDFCKYMFLEPSAVGYTGKASLAEITPFNYPHLNSMYVTRNNNEVDELPYLFRSFNKGGNIHLSPCVCIAVVLYNKDQLHKEGVDIQSDWGIVSVQAEPEWGISPMTPATIIRNALGVEFGGNGVPIDREYYRKSVEYWSRWAMVN